MRTRLAFILVAVTVISLLGGAIAVGSPAPVQQSVPVGGQVAVTVTVLPSLESTFAEGGVIVRSNVPWSVSADTVTGERLVILGEPTDGQYVALPGAVGAPEVCAR